MLDPTESNVGVLNAVDATMSGILDGVRDPRLVRVLSRILGIVVVGNEADLDPTLTVLAGLVRVPEM
jgi:hypothetical protein